MRAESNEKRSKKTKKNLPKKQKQEVESSSESDLSLQMDHDSDLDVSEFEGEHDDCANRAVEMAQIDPNQIMVDYVNSTGQK